MDAELTDTTVLEPIKTLSLSQALSLAANISSPFLTLSLNQKHHHKRKQWAPCLCKALLRHLPSVNWESRMMCQNQASTPELLFTPAQFYGCFFKQTWQWTFETPGEDTGDKGGGEWGQERIQETPATSQEESQFHNVTLVYPSSRVWLYRVLLYTDAFLFRSVRGCGFCSKFCWKSKCYAPGAPVLCMND